MSALRGVPVVWCVCMARAWGGKIENSKNSHPWGSMRIAWVAGFLCIGAVQEVPEDGGERVALLAHGRWSPAVRSYKRHT